MNSIMQVTTTPTRVDQTNQPKPAVPAVSSAESSVRCGSTGVYRSPRIRPEAPQPEIGLRGLLAAGICSAVAVAGLFALAHLRAGDLVSSSVSGSTVITTSVLAQ